MKLHWLDPRFADVPIGQADLDAVGVTYERLPLDEHAYGAALDRLMAERGYAERDIVELTPETPDLAGICRKFADEHLHTDDEVRYVLAGEGVFDIRSIDDRFMRVTVEPGDLIVVPAHLHHRFELTQAQHIRCVRLFKDAAGWVPHYRASLASDESASAAMTSAGRTARKDERTT